MATVEERGRLMRAFNDLDKNKDGRLSREELLEGYKKVKEFTSDSVEELIKKYDTDQSGYIDYSGS